MFAIAKMELQCIVFSNKGGVIEQPHPSSPIRRSCYGCWCGLISSHGRTTLSEFALKILLFISIAKDKPAYNVEYFVIFCKRKMIVSLVFLPHHDCRPHGERDLY